MAEPQGVCAADARDAVFHANVSRRAIDRVEQRVVAMEIRNIPFETVEWSKLEPTVHAGDTGSAFWRTRQFGAVRVRMVEYTPGYLANHWCKKGHVLLCLEGELRTELEDGRVFTLK